MSKNSNNAGKGHDGNITFHLTYRVEENGKVKDDTKVDLNVTMHFESIDYLIKDLASAIARVASNVANSMAEPDKEPARKPESVPV
jgi:hypothetical protein